MTKRQAFPAQRFMGTVAIALAGVCFYFGAWIPLRVSNLNTTWTPTACVVLSSEVAERTDTEPYGNTTRSYTVYEPAITYQYTVDGEQYTSSTVSLSGEGTRDASAVEAIVARYPVGAERSCLVDPTNPDAAILEHHPRGLEEYVFAAGALVLLLTGLFLIFKG